MATMQTQVQPTKMGSYVYCVISSDDSGLTINAPPFDAGGQIAASGGVRIVREGDLAAVVSEAPIAEYDPSRANVAAHERVVEEALEKCDILPMRFGTIAGNERDVGRFLREKHDDLARSLARVRGRVELGLKVLFDRDRMFAEIIDENPDIRAFRNALAAAPEAMSHDQRIEMGRMTFDMMEQKRQSEADRIVERMRPHAVDVVVNRLLSETMILNAAFLVERSGIDAFDAAVNALDAEQAGRLEFKSFGPLPPYNFVDLVVRNQAA